MTRFYTASDWYWIVPGHPGEVYASARQIYVASSDATYIAFLADGNVATSIASEDDLRDVLANAGVQYLSEAPRILEEDRPRIIRARCRLQVASAASSNAVALLVPFDTEIVDPLNMHANSPNPDRIQIAQTGTYLCVAGARFLEGSAAGGGVPNTGLRAIQLRIGAATVIATTRVGAAPQDNTEIQVIDPGFSANAGDILRMFVEQRCGGTMNVAARLHLQRVE